MAKWIRSLNAALLGAALTVGSVAADPAPSVDELVDFFAESALLGEAKGLCIGTAQECADANKPKSRDMLVTFELGSAQLTEAAKANLDIYARALQDDRIVDLNFAVEGHTDGLGTEVFNDGLSQDRAVAVLTYMITKGVAPDRLSAAGFGESKPRTENVYDPENRRVEVRVNLR